MSIGLSSEERIKLSNLLSRGKNLISDESLVGRDPHEWKQRAERLFDLYGKLLIFEKDYKDFIDISSYEKGIYFITAELNGKIITNKIILQ